MREYKEIILTAHRTHSALRRILIFAQNSTARDTEGVVKRLAESIEVQIDSVIFTTHHEQQGDSSLLLAFDNPSLYWYIQMNAQLRKLLPCSGIVRFGKV